MTGSGALHVSGGPSGSRPDYTMRVTDPATFTEPVELKKYWIWLPDNEVQSIQCID